MGRVETARSMGGGGGGRRGGSSSFRLPRSALDWVLSSEASSVSCSHEFTRGKAESIISGVSKNPSSNMFRVSMEL